MKNEIFTKLDELKALFDELNDWKNSKRIDEIKAILQNKENAANVAMRRE